MLHALQALYKASEAEGEPGKAGAQATRMHAAQELGGLLQAATADAASVRAVDRESADAALFQQVGTCYSLVMSG